MLHGRRIKSAGRMRSVAREVRGTSLACSGAKLWGGMTTGELFGQHAPHSPANVRQTSCKQHAVDDAHDFDAPLAAMVCDDCTAPVDAERARPLGGFGGKDLSSRPQAAPARRARQPVRQLLQGVQEEGVAKLRGSTARSAPTPRASAPSAATARLDTSCTACRSGFTHKVRRRREQVQVGGAAGARGGADRAPARVPAVDGPDWPQRRRAPRSRPPAIACSPAR